MLQIESVADPGFPVGGGVDPLGGCEPLMRALFGKNGCKNERIGSHRGSAPGMPPRSANESDDHFHIYDQVFWL